MNMGTHRVSPGMFPDHDGVHRCSSTLEFTSAAFQSCSPHAGTGGTSIQLGRQGQGSVRDQPPTPGIQLRHPDHHSNSLLSPLEFFQSLHGCSHHTRNSQDTQHSHWPLPKPDLPCSLPLQEDFRFCKNDVLHCAASETFITQ